MTTRRQLLQAVGIATAVGLAGCTGRGAPAKNCVKLPTEPDYARWLDKVDRYNGTCDMRGHEHVTVAVGARGKNGFVSYDPVAVAVSPGTTVRWEWTGRGGGHDVVSDTGLFTSGKPVSAAGTTFEHTFDAPGIYNYYCTPHRGMHMKGLVLVTVE